ncbi:MAG: sialate O-acetylesterase [Pseudomonadota bacterium]
MVMRALAALLMSSAAAAAAAPTLDPMFADHAVIQRDAPIRVRGTAAPGEAVQVTLGGQSGRGKSDKAGHWVVAFAGMPAGGPYRIDVRGQGGTAGADDVMLGDVWLCSGQSNMEFPLRAALNGDGEVAGASDAQLRLMKVPRNRVMSPQASFPNDVTWKPATPDSAKDFSAACYFMARSLRQSHGVAIGAIDSTWGGTAIAAWMDEAAVRGIGGAADVDLIREYRADPEATVRHYGERWSGWWRERSGDDSGAEPWRASDRLQWRAFPKMTLWEQWGDPAFADFDGAIWARVRFSLSPEEAARGATLHLGAIDDFDRTFVNGEAVGQTLMYNKPRDYPLRPGLLKAGINEIVVYVLDTGGGGGFSGPADILKLSFADGGEKPIGQGWQYSVVPTRVGTPPLPPWGEYPGPTTLYGGMIAPLGTVRLKGVAWYQGEEDVGKPGYDARLAAMMKSWRGQFADPALPFVIVGLAGFGQPVSAPAPSNWAALINEQRLAVDCDPHAALVSAIDVGERADIHPHNKQEVGRRLALGAEALAYGSDKAPRTPKLLSSTRANNGIVVRFDQPLVIYGGATALGFELCGDVQESCRYATAHVQGSSILLDGDGRPATRVRYAWANYPIVNLYGPGRLPLPTFESPIGP